MNKTIYCAKCWKEVIKRSENQTLCMDCAYKVCQKSIKKIYDIDIREMSLECDDENEKEI